MSAAGPLMRHTSSVRRRGGLVGGVMLALVIGIVAAAPLAGAGARLRTGIDVRVVLSSGRAFVLHVPPQLRSRPDAAAGRPALMVLHGLTSNAHDVAAMTGFDRLADRDGVLVAYPEGVRNSFNAGLCCFPASELGVDDVGFLSAVVADLHARGASRVAAVGFSNGGMMAYRLACTRPDLVDTIGVVAGTLEIPVCNGPIRALHLHGLDDFTVPPGGAPHSGLLRAFLRDVRTIAGAAPGSDIELHLLPNYTHRWSVSGDPIDETQAFWRFAHMGSATPS